MAPSSQPIRTRIRESVFLRDTVVVIGLLTAMYLVAPRVQSQALQIPGYLLIVGFGMLEGVFGAVRTGFEVVFALYIVVLGLSGAVLAHGFRKLGAETALSAWRAGLAAGLVIVAVIAAHLGAMTYSGTMQSEPVKILGTTAIVLLVAAGLLADVFGVTSRLENAFAR